MLDDIRSQINQLKANQESDMSRLETRMNLKIDESHRNTEKFDRLDRKIDEYTQSMNKRFVSFEDEFQKNLNKLSTSIEVNLNKYSKINIK